MIAQRRFRAMGVEAHVIVVDGPESAAPAAEARVRDLEARWSRFLPDSEVTSINRAVGRPVTVSDDTLTLFAAAREGWELTDGAFDPTVRPSVIAAGYPTADAAGPASPGPGPAPGCAGMAIDTTRRTVQLPRGVSFDPGGIGKGLGADLVTAELRACGSAGALVNLGGDVRAWGVGPDGAGWTIAVEDPFRPDRDMWRATLGDGGLASSSTLARTWSHGGRVRHHLVDPSTGDAPASEVVAASVLAGSAWLAEVFTKVAMMLTPVEAITRLERAGMTGLIVGRDGHLSVTSRIGMFV